MSKLAAVLYLQTLRHRWGWTEPSHDGNCPHEDDRGVKMTDLQSQGLRDADTPNWGAGAVGIHLT